MWIIDETASVKSQAALLARNTVKSSLLGPMFVDCQNFAGSWGHSFAGSWFVTLQYKTSYYFVKCFCLIC